ncbi:hypothetical protein DFH07DRAFT_823947 [Mycena maculata]|uniref:Secreted protein n=1 Tax=Mycena maculata TaxID=230809 RepID=A0AAD7NBE1_9AGAR|nr:hypothetical protein DFH07DRAFT_823947 [Mycena maculata]
MFCAMHRYWIVLTAVSVAGVERGRWPVEPGSGSGAAAGSGRMGMGQGWREESQPFRPCVYAIHESGGKANISELYSNP